MSLSTIKVKVFFPLATGSDPIGPRDRFSPLAWPVRGFRVLRLGRFAAGLGSGLANLAAPNLATVYRLARSDHLGFTFEAGWFFLWHNGWAFGAVLDSIPCSA
jgi:hypothetical protein